MNSIELILLSLMSVIVLFIFLYLYKESNKHQKIADDIGKEVKKVLKTI
jgi:uncharacterized membrane protein